MRKGICSVLFVLILAVGAAAQVKPADIDVIPDVVYGHKDGMALTFDVFKPKTHPNGAAVIFMVSGGWISAWAPPDQIAPRYQEFYDKGFTVITLRHGSSPRYLIPEIVADVRRGVRFIRFNARRWGIDRAQCRLVVDSNRAQSHANRPAENKLRPRPPGRSLS